MRWSSATSAKRAAKGGNTDEPHRGSCSCTGSTDWERNTPSESRLRFRKASWSTPTMDINSSVGRNCPCDPGGANRWL